jgi:HD superfamily phosphohydrolase
LKRFIFAGLLFCSFWISVNRSAVKNPAVVKKIETFYGSMSIHEPLLLDLVAAEATQRLGKVHQYGVRPYTHPGSEHYDRLQHSLGVLYILRLHGAETLEQAAGLGHDLSHTVFSHVGDFIYKHEDGKDSYQDTIHLRFLRRHGINTILAKHGHSLQAMDHKEPKYKMLEQDLPGMCADRIDYNIQGGYYHGLTTKTRAMEMLHSLGYDKQKQKWYFHDQKLAAEFAFNSIYMSKNIWSEAKGAITYHWAAAVIRRALNEKIITVDDIGFGKDEEVWNKLKASKSKGVHMLLDRLQHSDRYHTYMGRKQKKSCSYLSVHSKFRGVNPLVKVGDKLIPLSELDPVFKHKFSAETEYFRMPHCIKHW